MAEEGNARRHRGSTLNGLDNLAHLCTYLSPSKLLLDSEHGEVTALHAAMVVKLAYNRAEGTPSGPTDRDVAEVWPVIYEVAVGEYGVGFAQLLVNQAHDELEVVFTLVLMFFLR